MTTDYDITEAMIVYGGGFVQLLGRLYRHADIMNQARIREAWPEYWQQYSDIAAKRLSVVEQAHG